jgi:hypothetical protein
VLRLVAVALTLSQSALISRTAHNVSRFQTHLRINAGLEEKYRPKLDVRPQQSSIEGFGIDGGSRLNSDGL